MPSYSNAYRININKDVAASLQKRFPETPIFYITTTLLNIFLASGDLYEGTADDVFIRIKEALEIP